MPALKKAKRQKLLLLSAKIGCGSALAIVLAELCHLSSPAAAGMIALLTLSSTRVQTVRLIGQRFVTCILSILLCFILFGLLHSAYLAFALFLVLIVFILGATDTMPTLSVNAMIGMHVLSQPITWEFFWNELALMAIGTGIAFVFSYIHPLRSNESSLRRAAEKVDSRFEAALEQIAAILEQSNTAEDCWDEIGGLIDEAGHWRAMALEYRENAWDPSAPVFEKLFALRIEQISVLHSLKNQHAFLASSLKEAAGLHALFHETAAQCRQAYVPETLWQNIETRRLQLLSHPEHSSSDLEPVMAEYQILMDLQDLLLLKKEMVSALNDRELQLYLTLHQADQ